MAYRDTAVDPIPRFPDAASLSAVPDWRRLYEQTLERAEAAEARAEELKWAEVAARGALGSLQWQLKEARRKRIEAVEAANEARRVASNAFSLQAEVRRLKDLLADAGVASHRSSVIGLRREIVRLRKDVLETDRRGLPPQRRAAGLPRRRHRVPERRVRRGAARA